MDDRDLEMWLDLDWPEPIMKIPASMISQLIRRSSSSSSLLTLKFRVWVRLVDAEDTWAKSALASAFDEIDVMIGGAPSPGSCELFVSNNETSPIISVIELETPVRVRCLDWMDPILSVMDPGTEMSYSTTLLRRRAQSSHCSSSTSTTSHPTNNEFESDEVVVPRHRFASTQEVEAVLPYGCWTVYAEIRSEHSGLASLSLLDEALDVQLPAERRRFASDVAYFHFALERELSASALSIPAIASAIMN